MWLDKALSLEKTVITTKHKPGNSWIQIVVRNFSTTMAASSFDSILRFFAYGYLARQMGPEVFGINSFMYTTTFFFGSLSDFGLRVLGTRDIASQSGRIERQVNSTLSLKLVLTVIAYILMQLFIMLTRNSTQVRWLALIYGLGLFGTTATDWILMGLEQMHHLGIARIINGVGVFALVLALVHGPRDLLLVGFIESCTCLLAGGYLLYVASKKVRLRLSFRLVEWSTLLKEAFPLGVSLIMIRLGTSLPVFALGLLSSDYELGIYKAVSLLPSFLERSTTLLAEALLPTLSRIYVRSEQYFAKVMVWIHKYMTAGGILIGVMGILLGMRVLPRVFGEEFSAGLGTFQVLMIVSTVIFSNASLRRLLPACRSQRQYAYVTAFRTVALLILSLILARQGSRAEAWAVLLAEGGTLGLSMYFFQSQFSSSQMLPTFAKVLIAGVTFALSVWSLKDNLVVATLVSVAIYGIMLILFRVISPDDIRFIKFDEAASKSLRLGL